VDSLTLQKRVGPTVVRLDLEALFRKAPEISRERVQKALAENAQEAAGRERLDSQQVERSTRFEAVLSDQVQGLGLSAVAVRCWPEFITAYEAAACSTLGHLNDAGVPAACEADVLGAVSMLMQQRLSGQVTFLGDMVNVDEGRNSATFWHCGSGAPSLASAKTGARAGVQPNRNVGLAFDHRLKAGAVTICRLGQTDAGLRMFLASAQALDDLEHFSGTSVEVRFQRPVRELLELIIGGGFEFHFSIVWADVAAELKHVCALLDIPLTVF
jgi:L-fucose isomerase-like protein